MTTPQPCPDRPEKFCSSVPIIGILGGIGSGKSSVAAAVSRYRLHVIDADQIGHQLLDTAAVQEAVIRTFGSSVVSSEGRIDRSRLAAVVFEDSVAGRKSRQILEQILHPEIRRESIEQIRNAPQDADAVILDAALLLEAGWADVCEALVFVDTPQPVREARVLKNRGWSAAELARRESAQWSPERKRVSADYVVDNSGSLPDSARQLELFLESLLTRTSRAPRRLAPPAADQRI